MRSGSAKNEPASLKSEKLRIIAARYNLQVISRATL